MNYPSLSLSKDLIDSAFSVQIKDPKNQTFNGNLVKCDKCDYKTAKKFYMDNQTRGKHPKTKNNCTQCNFTHAFPTKIKQHYNIVHLGIKRLDYKFRCKIDFYPKFGKDTCPYLEQHSLLFCN